MLFPKKTKLLLHKNNSPGLSGNHITKIFQLGNGEQEMRSLKEFTATQDWGHNQKIFLNHLIVTQNHTVEERPGVTVCGEKCLRKVQGSKYKAKIWE